MKTEYVMLAKKYKNQDVIGWYASEKLDGMRGTWDGGISIGKWADEVPYANTTKDKKRVRATGLWSRGGKVIYAPDWWIDGLPKGVILDGELYLGRGRFQELMSIVKNQSGKTDWEDVSYEVFDAPGGEQFFQTRTISTPVHSFSVRHSRLAINEKLNYAPFHEVLDWLTEQGIDHVDQTIIESVEHIDRLMDSIVSQGGEGLVLRNPETFWVPFRSKNLLKVKPENDDEGMVIGAVSGRGKLRGMMGALIIQYKGNTFQLSGFTEEERELTTKGHKDAWDHQSQTIPLDCVVNFEFEQTITFKYRELSDSGIPKEAKYLR
jgi:DNA ligase-1